MTFYYQCFPLIKFHLLYKKDSEKEITVIPQYNVDFGASQKSMLYQNLCYIEVYLKYKEKTRICKGSSLISLNEKNHHMSNKVSLNKTVILQLIYKQMSFLLRDVDVL